MGGRAKSKEALGKKIEEEMKVSRGTAHKAINEAIKQGRVCREHVGDGKASPLFLPGGDSHG